MRSKWDGTLPAFGWQPTWFQLKVWQYLERGGRRAVCVWPRRHGKDYFSINWCATASQARIGTYWMVYPFLNQGRRIAWNGMDKEGKRFIHAFPPELVESQSNAEMRLHLKNGSVFQIMGADKPDSLVGSNPIGIVFSEWSLMDPHCWKLIAPILAQNDGWAMWIYTPRGPNHGLSLLNRAKANGKSWYWSHETAKSLKYQSLASLRELRDELQDEALFQQEAFCSFETPMQGAYYATQIKRLRKDNRFGKVPWESKVGVVTSWDLGMDDATTIWFFQIVGHEIRVIDYYENSGEGLAHYVKILKEKPYHYDKHYFPWDVSVRDLSTGKTRVQTLREMGLSNLRPVQKLGVMEGIEATRNILPKMWFDDSACERGISCLASYQKEWDEDRKVFKTSPLHNWASHGADAMRTFGVGFRKSNNSHKQKDTKMMEVEYDILSS
tara:strand:+ start:1261 stop:2580 length:1320 start_codon:yes stop_codon:yes gene_type:complete